MSVEVLHVALGGVEELVASLLERMDDGVVDAVSYTHLTLPTTPYV